jgi:hypothetical protein
MKSARNDNTRRESNETKINLTYIDPAAISRVMTFPDIRAVGMRATECHPR